MTLLVIQFLLPETTNDILGRGTTGRSGRQSGSRSGRLGRRIRGHRSVGAAGEAHNATLNDLKGLKSVAAEPPHLRQQRFVALQHLPRRHPRDKPRRGAHGLHQRRGIVLENWDKVRLLL